MNILVTGGTGFTGYHLVKRLVQNGHTVTAFDKNPGLFADELRSLGVVIAIGDIFDREQVIRCVTGQEIVFHLAAAFRGINVSKKTYWNTNVEGTRYIAEAALNEHVDRFIYCSTEGVHGKIEHPPADENAPIQPKDYYQRTKYEGERVVDEYAARGLKTVILRPTAIYGPGDPGRFLMLYKQVKRGIFPMFGTGEVTYHPVYIDNLVDAFILAMEKDQAIGNTYLIGDDTYISLIDLVNTVAASMGSNVKFIFCPYWILLSLSCVCEWICKPFKIKPPLFKRRAEWYWENRGFSIEKAKRELGYVSKISLAKGLSITYHWYRENGYLTDA